MPHSFLSLRGGVVRDLQKSKLFFASLKGPEMHRVYPPVASNSAEQRSEQRHAPVQQRDRTDELVAALREQLADMRNDRDRARSDADTWRTAFEQECAQRALPVPRNDAQALQTTPGTPADQSSRFRRAWRWMRSTG